ncbi:MAG: phosphohydrolase, partial [Ruminococcus sp.]|nr:phosphohydrolase [Ruminococcus sp.]
MDRIEIRIPEYAAELMRTLEKAGYEVWCVGGCVRDALMGVTPHDWDLCTSAMPEEMMEVFGGFRTIPTGLKHGTLTVLNRGETVEITTYRCDGDYLDHRRQESVTFVRDIRNDLERRDFTMNAICLDLRGQIYDPFDGEGDIRRGLIRCVGEPRKRFDEDAL